MENTEPLQIGDKVQYRLVGTATIREIVERLAGSEYIVARVEWDKPHGIYTRNDEHTYWFKPADRR